MIDIDLRRYGTDKEYEKFVNGIISGADIDEEPTVISLNEHNNKLSKIKDEELTLECEFEKDSVEKLKKLCSIPEDIQRKIVDIYNYMATNKAGKIVLQFETGIKMICEIDEMEGCHSCLYEDMFDTDKEPCKYCYGLSLYTKKENNDDTNSDKR